MSAKKSGIAVIGDSPISTTRNAGILHRNKHFGVRVIGGDASDVLLVFGKDACALQNVSSCPT